MVWTRMHLYVHRAPDGSIWSCGADDVPQRHWATLEKFLRADSKALPSRLCVIGNAENAKLILAAAAKAIRRRNLQIFLGSPHIIRRHGRRQDPVASLRAARANRNPVTAGGWHALSEFDKAQYRLVEAVKRGDSLKRITNLLHAHPAWPALGFLPDFDFFQAALVLSDIVDVRWFGSRLSPDRSNKLRNFLGITARNVSFLAGVDSRPRQSDELQRVVRLNEMFFGRQADEQFVAGHPRYFLWRSRRQKAATVGLRNGLVMGVEFVRNVWLQSVAQKGEEVFVPEYFFALNSEAAAYKEATAKRPSK